MLTMITIVIDIMCNGTIQTKNKLKNTHGQRTVFLSYDRVHVGKAFVPDYRIIYTIRQPGVKKALDFPQNWLLVKMTKILWFQFTCLCVWGSPLLLISHRSHLVTAWAGSTRSLIPATLEGQRKEEIPHNVNFPLCKGRIEQECGGVLLQTLEKCDIFKAPSCLSNLTGSKAERIKWNCWCQALNLLQHP